MKLRILLIVLVLVIQACQPQGGKTGGRVVTHSSERGAP